MLAAFLLQISCKVDTVGILHNYMYLMECINALVIGVRSIKEFLYCIDKMVKSICQTKLTISMLAKKVVTVFPNTSRVSNGSRGRSKGEYTARLVGLPGISLCSNKYKTKNLGVLNTCSSVNRVVLIEAEGF